MEGKDSQGLPQDGSESPPAPTLQLVVLTFSCHSQEGVRGMPFECLLKRSSNTTEHQINMLKYSNVQKVRFLFTSTELEAFRYSGLEISIFNKNHLEKNNATKVVHLGL